jgi:hypothetical protein
MPAAYEFLLGRKHFFHSFDPPARLLREWYAVKGAGNSIVALRSLQNVDFYSNIISCIEGGIDHGVPPPRVGDESGDTAGVCGWPSHELD